MTRRAAVAAVAVAVALVATGCSAQSGSDATSPDPQAGVTQPAAFAIDQDFPDPDVLATGGRYYAYATNGSGFNIQVATSTDLADWSVLPSDALPTLPAWSLPGKTWAPDVSEQAPGEFVMYFTVASKNPALQCIGVATATEPAGPFTPVGSGPIVCPADTGGAIDPATFVDDDGTRYLVWKNDGNCCGLDTWLQIARLSADSTALVGDTTKLLMQDQDWEGNLIEAPTLVKRDGVYVLLYSANDYGGDSYAIGFATAPSVLGPYLKGPYPEGSGPLLGTAVSGGRYLGPGGQDVVTAPDGSDVLVFHSWDELYIERGVNGAPLTWSAGVPTVHVD